MTTTDAGELVTTFAAAHDRNPYELARDWVGTGMYLVELHRDAADVQLGELATMATLAHWLTRWQPLQMHRAILAGATVDQVAAAAGVDTATVAERWRQWADEQRSLTIADRPALAADEYDRVAGAFAAAGWSSEYDAWCRRVAALGCVDCDGSLAGGFVATADGERGRCDGCEDARLTVADQRGE